MTPTILVVTTVHRPDDTRIRDRLIRTLTESFRVVYACRPPGPTDSQHITWLPLRGGRIMRNVEALLIMLRTDWDAAVVHDPELIPGAVMTRLLRRRQVVFDVHEDLPAQIDSKSWIPRWMRAAARVTARLLYRLAEQTLTLTLAESGYLRLFKHAHKVFPNYPNYENWPDVSLSSGGYALYLGDVQPPRGVAEAVMACGKSGIPLRVIGPASESFSNELRVLASIHGTELELLGPMPNPRALEEIADASVGLSPLLPFPNYLHSLATKTLEYLAMGLPVVASDLPGTREVLEPWKAVWLVAPGDVEQMADAIRAAAQSESKEMAGRQAGEVRSRFAWPSEEVLSFYRALVER